VIAQELPVPRPRPEEISDRADAIVQRPEYRQTQSWLERASGWLDDVLGDIIGGLASGGVGGVVSWLILAVLVGVILWLLIRLTPVAGLARAASTEAVVTTQGPEATEFLTAEEWRREAARLAAAGDYDRALRARYRALLAELIDRGLIEDIAGRTPGEYRRDLQSGARREVAEPFSSATDLFEEIWYGPDKADERHLGRFDENERRVLSEVGR
jgi:hypothetical protein